MISARKFRSDALKKTCIHLPHDHGTTLASLVEVIPDMTLFFEVSETFSLLSDSTRLKILWILCHTEDCVANIAAAVEMTSPAVSHHLRLLRQSGLVTATRHGKEVYYTIAETKEAELIHRIIDATFEMNCAAQGGVPAYSGPLSPPPEKKRPLYKRTKKQFPAR